MSAVAARQTLAAAQHAEVMRSAVARWLFAVVRWLFALVRWLFAVARWLFAVVMRVGRAGAEKPSQAEEATLAWG